MAEIEITPPCLGSVGSKPFLDDVQAQLNENFHANREGRDPNILPVQCRLCQGYHHDNQLDATTYFPGTDFDAYAYDRIVPNQAGHTYATNDLLRSAHMAVNGGQDPFPSEEITDAAGTE